MAEQDLRNQLNQLHEELESAKNLPTEERDMLGHLMTDMVKIAQGDELPEEHHATLRERLEQKESEFELDHPRLAGVIRHILDSLNRMGI